MRCPGKSATAKMKSCILSAKEDGDSVGGLFKVGKGQVKKGSRQFYKILIESGIPKENALAIAKAYATPGYEMLSIRNLIRMAREMDKSEN